MPQAFLVCLMTIFACAAASFIAISRTARKWGLGLQPAAPEVLAYAVEDGNGAGRSRPHVNPAGAGSENIQHSLLVPLWQDMAVSRCNRSYPEAIKSNFL
jgi:hypothetical protein